MPSPFRPVCVTHPHASSEAMRARLPGIPRIGCPDRRFRIPLQLSRGSTEGLSGVAIYIMP